MGPILEIGESLVNGKIRLFNDRLEFQLRSQHVMVPIDQIGGISTEGIAPRKLKVHTKAGDLIEVKSVFKEDYDRLTDGVRRIRAGETLAPAQLVREQYEPLQREFRDFTQDENVRGCTVILGVVFAILVVIGLIVSAVQWVFNAIASLF